MIPKGPSIIYIYIRTYPPQWGDYPFCWWSISPMFPSCIFFRSFDLQTCSGDLTCQYWPLAWPVIWTERWKEGHLTIGTTNIQFLVVLCRLRSGVCSSFLLSRHGNEKENSSLGLHLSSSFWGATSPRQTAEENVLVASPFTFRPLDLSFFDLEQEDATNGTKGIATRSDRTLRSGLLALLLGTRFATRNKEAIKYDRVFGPLDLSLCQLCHSFFAEERFRRSTSATPVGHRNEREREQ